MSRLMERSIHQALYKYLPEQWGDFYDKDARISYSMKVTDWNSIPLENVNKERIFSEVKNEVTQFMLRGGRVIGLNPATMNPSNFVVLTPKASGNPQIPDIVSNISPLTFFCTKCHSVKVFPNSSFFINNPRNSKCDKPGCNGELKQIGLIYACTCGWAGPLVPNKCNTPGHGIHNLTYRAGDFKFTCKLDGIRVEMMKRCSECNTTLFPKNIATGDIFVPFNFTMIELLEQLEEKFVLEVQNSSHVVISKWIGRTGEEEYKKIIKYDKNNEEMFSSMETSLFRSLVESGLPEEQARAIARSTVQRNNPENIIDEKANEVKPLIYANHLDNEYTLKKTAISILEYNTILDSGVSISILEGANKALQGNSIFSIDEYLEVEKKYGFKSIKACGNIPILNCVYGYTRLGYDPKDLPNGDLTLRAIKQEVPGQRNVYATRLTTEGILFELDRGRIIKWLIDNGVLDNNQAPDVDNDEELKLWFINNIDLGAINSFSKIDKSSSKYTYYVYNLIHSLSHALIKESEDFSGLDKNSLAEYLFPSVPAFFIYCQNTQGTSLGSLFSLFGSVLHKWLSKTNENMNKCVFDPICIDGVRRGEQGGLVGDDTDIACIGCLYINEVSCRHFNKDLNRRFIIGYTDVNNNKTYGYWEEH